VQIVDKDGVVKAEEFVTPTSDNNWAMTTPTSVLALGDYTIKAEIVDVAGNVVKSGEHALKVVDSVLTAMPDTATVREDLTLKAEGNLIRGTSSGNGTDVDTNERFETLKIDKIKAGNGSFQDVGSETTITGTFGDLTLKADGTYTYTLKNTDTKVQALTNTGTTGLDEFTYEVTNSKGQRSSTTLKVMVNGTDDTAVITPPINNQNSIGSSTTGNLKDTRRLRRRIKIHRVVQHV
jgi:VCBS repeat-containing protein